MGVEPYLIPPVLILGIAQRLVRTLCPGGGKKMSVEGSMKEMITKEFADLPAEYRKEIPDFTEVYRIQPTDECPSGTQGRVACFEAFDMTPELEQAILARKPEDELRAIVRRQGMLTMKEDAMIKSAQGIVPFEEVNTLGGEFELEDIAATPPPPEPEAISEEGVIARPAKKALRWPR